MRTCHPSFDHDRTGRQAPNARDGCCRATTLAQNESALSENRGDNTPAERPVPPAACLLLEFREHVVGGVEPSLA